MDICEQLRGKLREATARNKANAILLSGGVDTSILAFIAKPKGAFTVALKDSQASDLDYSERVSRLLGIEYKKMEFSVEEALNTLPKVIRILKTFNLALPNDLSIYFALKLVKKCKISLVMTGDGSDELFAGYPYMAKLSLEDLERYIRGLSKSWHFSANDLGGALGIEVKQPFLDGDFVRFALNIPSELKVKEGVGKYILRKSFECLLPQEIIWRKKEPIEYGSGSTKLHEIVGNMVSDEEFQSTKEKTGIRFINKEHCFYYRIYSEVVGEIPKAKSNEERCPWCGASIDKAYCRVCGFSPSLNEYLLSLR
jgi:Asparagine synthase (glutamine-hydrolyzing)